MATYHIRPVEREDPTSRVEDMMTSQSDDITDTHRHTETHRNTQKHLHTHTHTQNTHIDTHTNTRHHTSRVEDMMTDHITLDT